MCSYEEAHKMVSYDVRLECTAAVGLLVGLWEHKRGAVDVQRWKLSRRRSRKEEDGAEAGWGELMGASVTTGCDGEDGVDSRWSSVGSGECECEVAERVPRHSTDGRDRLRVSE